MTGAATTERKSAFGMTANQRGAFLRFSQGMLLATTVFTGVVIALQIAALYDFPGTEATTFADKVMRVLSFLVDFTVLGTLIKASIVPFVGPRIERRLGTNRPVKLRQVFNRDIRWTAIAGGSLNAVYSTLFVFLAPYLAPTALAASRACIVLALIPVEWFVGALPQGRKWVVRTRLTLSVIVTLGGAAIVIFADGFDLFKAGVPDDMRTMLWVVFVLLIGPGNFVLALAELAELRGVQKPDTAPAVYTLARFMAFTGTVCSAALVWGSVFHGWHMFVGVLNMSMHRWYLWVPISLGWALTDLVRICVKTVVPATYMYVVMSLAVAIDAITQTLLKHKWSDIYKAVPGSGVFAAVCFLGGLVIAAGSLLWPHEKQQPELPVGAAGTMP